MTTPKEFPRQTVNGPIQVEGVGLHGAIEVRVTIEPYDAGIVFVSGDETFEAHPDQVTDTTRCTKLGSISTVEHLMSAFAGLGVTDARVLVDGPEMPAMGGASKEWVDILKRTGLRRIGTLRVTPPYARVFDKGDHHSLAIGTGSGHWRYDFVTGERWPATQSFEAFLDPTFYSEHIAPARTFAFEEELDHLTKAGLGQGLDESSALVLGTHGYVNPSRFPDEPARHKLLDLIGDLYLSGIPPQAIDVVAERSGHAANVRVAAKLLAASKIERL